MCHITASKSPFSFQYIVLLSSWLFAAVSQVADGRRVDDHLDWCVLPSYDLLHALATSYRYYHVLYPSHPPTHLLHRLRN